MTRHNWTKGDCQHCTRCGLERRRPYSRVRRGRRSISDWDYLIANTWKRLQRVPPCGDLTNREPTIEELRKAML